MWIHSKVIPSSQCAINECALREICGLLINYKFHCVLVDYDYCQMIGMDTNEFRLRCQICGLRNSANTVKSDDNRCLALSLSIHKKKEKLSFGEKNQFYIQKNNGYRNWLVPSETRILLLHNWIPDGREYSSRNYTIRLDQRAYNIYFCFFRQSVPEILWTWEDNI